MKEETATWTPATKYFNMHCLDMMMAKRNLLQCHDYVCTGTSGDAKVAKGLQQHAVTCPQGTVLSHRGF